jgi:hypothetical protein
MSGIRAKKSNSQLRELGNIAKRPEYARGNQAVVSVGEEARFLYRPMVNTVTESQ